MNAILGLLLFFLIAPKLALMARGCKGVEGQTRHTIRVVSTVAIAVGALGLGAGWVGPEMLLIGLIGRFGVQFDEQQAHK